MHSIGSIRDGQEAAAYLPPSVNGRFREFFEELYTSRVDYLDSDLSSFLDSVAFPFLTMEDRERVEGNVTLKEVQAAVSGLKGGKTPGADGFPSEFYSNFAELLAPRLRTLLSDFESLEALPDSMKEAVIVLVPMLGKDPLDCASYRPISLLNVDAKIFAKILANRLSQVIEVWLTLTRQDSCRVKGLTLTSDSYF